jgi:hypothetical protein
MATNVSKNLRIQLDTNPQMCIFATRQPLTYLGLEAELADSLAIGAGLLRGAGGSELDLLSSLSVIVHGILHLQ